MEFFDQQPPGPSIIPARPARPSAVWLLFATILGAIVGGAVVYLSVDTSPESDTSAGDAPAVTTTTLAPDETTTTVAPVTVDSTLDFAYQASYPVEGSSTGLITLTDGVGQEALADSDSSLAVSILQTIPADLDGDGIEEAIAILSVSTGGTGVFHFVHGVFNDPDGVLATNGVPLGDRIAIDDVAVDPVSGRVTVRYRDRSEQVAFSEPHDLLVVSDLQILTFGASEVGRGVIALADADDPQLTAAATITTGGLGPIRVGMTVEEATEASGLAVVGPTEGVVEASPGCGFARSRWLRRGRLHAHRRCDRSRRRRLGPHRHRVRSHDREYRRGDQDPLPRRHHRVAPSVRRWQLPHTHTHRRKPRRFPGRIRNRRRVGHQLPLGSNPRGRVDRGLRLKHPLGRFPTNRPLGAD